MPGAIAMLNGWQGTESLWHLGGRDSVILWFGLLASRTPASVYASPLVEFGWWGMAHPHCPTATGTFYRAWGVDDPRPSLSVSVSSHMFV